MDNKFFLHQIKRTNGTFDNGIVVKTGGTQNYSNDIIAIGI